MIDALMLLLIYSCIFLAHGLIFDLIANNRVGALLTIATGLCIYSVAGYLLTYLSVFVDGILIYHIYAGIAVGALYGCFLIYRLLGKTDTEKEPIRNVAIIGAVFAVAYIVYSALLVPQPMFNPGDDFKKYMFHTHALSVTGDVFGSQFSALGIATFGAQSILQLPAYVFSGLGHINIVDIAFARALVLALLVAVGLRLQVRPVLIALALVLYVLINPRIVNISAYYTLLVPVMVIYCLTVFRSGGSAFGTTLVALTAASCLVALKTTSVVFMLPLVVAYLVFLFDLIRADVRSAAVDGIAVPVGIAVALILIWCAPHFDRYVQIAANATSSLGTGEFLFEGGTRNMQIDHQRLSDLFTDPGHNFNELPVVIFMFCALCLLPIASRFVRTEEAVTRPSAQIAADTAKPDRYVLIALAGTSVLMVFIYVYGGSALFRRQFAWIRYGLPFLTLATCLAVFYSQRILDAHRSSAARVASLVILLAPLPFLVYGGATRYWAMIQHGTEYYIVDRPKPQAFHKITDSLLSDAAVQSVTKIQALVPEGATILAWIEVPKFLDLQRNQIKNIESIWYKKVFNRLFYLADVEQRKAALRDAGIDYVVWQYLGNTISDRKDVNVKRLMFSIHQASEEVANVKDGTGGYVVFRP